MTPAKCFACAASLCLGIGGVTVPAAAEDASATAPAAQATTAPSDTDYSLRIIRVSRGELLPDHLEIEKIIQRLGSKPSPKQTIESDVVGSSTTDLDLRIALSTEKPGARETMDQLVASLQPALVKEYEARKEQLQAPAQDRLTRAQSELEKLTREMLERRERAQSVTGRADSSATGIQEAAATMDAEHQRLELERVGKSARRQAIEEHIAAQSQQIEKRVSEDAIASELVKVVDAREQAIKLSQQRREAGIPGGDVADAVAAAAEARAKLLQRRIDAAGESGGETLEALNRDLTTLSIDLHELDARLKFVQEELMKLTEANKILEPMTRLDAQIARARENAERADSEWEAVTQKIRESAPPQIEVLSSEDRKAANSGGPVPEQY